MACYSPGTSYGKLIFLWWRYLYNVTPLRRHRFLTSWCPVPSRNSSWGEGHGSRVNSSLFYSLVISFSPHLPSLRHVFLSPMSLLYQWSSYHSLHSWLILIHPLHKIAILHFVCPDHLNEFCFTHSTTLHSTPLPPTSIPHLLHTLSSLLALPHVSKLVCITNIHFTISSPPYFGCFNHMHLGLCPPSAPPLFSLTLLSIYHPVPLDDSYLIPFPSMPQLLPLLALHIFAAQNTFFISVPICLVSFHMYTMTAFHLSESCPFMYSPLFLLI